MTGKRKQDKMTPKKAYFISHNQNKISEFRQILEPEIEIIPINLQIPEVKLDSCEEVIIYKAKHGYDIAKIKLGETPQLPILIEDSGFFIEKLDGFPGAYTAAISRFIGNRGFIDLMKKYSSEKDRTVSYKSVICLYDGQDMNIFIGDEQGTMAKSEKGKNGWGQDPIFIPSTNNPDKKTYGQMRRKDSVNIFRKSALEKLKEFMMKR